MPTVAHAPDRRPQADTAAPAGSTDWRVIYPTLAAEVDNLARLTALADQLGLPTAVAAR